MKRAATLICVLFLLLTISTVLGAALEFRIRMSVDIDNDLFVEDPPEYIHCMVIEEPLDTGSVTNRWDYHLEQLGPALNPDYTTYAPLGAADKLNAYYGGYLSHLGEQDYRYDYDINNPDDHEPQTLRRGRRRDADRLGQDGQRRGPARAVVGLESE